MTDVALNHVQLRSVVSSLATDGSTNSLAGLNVGCEIVHRECDSGRQIRVVVLGDGEPTVGNASEERILAMSREDNVDGIGLTTIGLGSDFRYSLMSNLARIGDGNLYCAENPVAGRCRSMVAAWRSPVSTWLTASRTIT